MAKRDFENIDVDRGKCIVYCRYKGKMLAEKGNM